LRKLGKYMERKVRKTEKISSILTINIKIELIFFLRKNYCPTLFVYFISTSGNLTVNVVPVPNSLSTSSFPL
ncbi:IS5/IS1182 family transposase, partial [Enterococcus hirae]